MIYTVRKGDTVDLIAAATGAPVEDIIYANQIEYPYRLAVGESLYVPSGAMPRERTPIRSFGYVYPFIAETVLQATLPFLTDLYIFSYGFTPEGELIEPPTGDAHLIGAAAGAGVNPVMVLTPLDAAGHFNDNLVTAVVGDPTVQERLIWNLGRTLQEKGYRGINIDFEYVQADDRVGFADFVDRVRRVMNVFGYPVTVALAPKTSADQKGQLYEGIDYALLGAAADGVMLMTYEWGYTYNQTGLWL